MFFTVWFFALTSALAVPELRPVLALLMATYTMASRTDRKSSLIAVALAVPTGILIAIRAELADNPDLSPQTLIASSRLNITRGVGRPPTRSPTGT